MMIRNILISVLFICLFILYYQNRQLADYSDIVENENNTLKLKINTLLQQNKNLSLKYLSPLYKEDRFYSELPYRYQWYLEENYHHINNYVTEDSNSLEEFYNSLDILPEIIYDKEKENLTIKFQMKKNF
ncbi:MAG: hypothetical protein ACNI3C_03305 [Candidatus Marinarcus sp.]|uniref:hypothetical protein n=1 Tax=Candidatus Marinarcus sp. TaxID=3100987 RepID=UPI003AFFF682